MSYLKKEGLATGLSAGTGGELHAFKEFYVDVDLTKKGLKEYETVLAAIFKYANKLKEVGPQDYVFEECKIIGQINFDFMSKGSALSYCERQTKNMQEFKTDEEMAHLFRHTYGPLDFDKERVAELQELVANPANCCVFLASKEFEPKGVLENESERWYKFPYENAPFSEELKKILVEHECPDNGLKLDLPPPNVLLPKNFDILPANVVYSAYPKLIKQWAECDLWYKKDDKFKLPKAKIGAKLYTNDSDFGITKKGVVFAHLW